MRRERLEIDAQSTDRDLDGILVKLQRIRSELAQIRQLGLPSQTGDSAPATPSGGSAVSAVNGGVPGGFIGGANGFAGGNGVGAAALIGVAFMSASTARNNAASVVSRGSAPMMPPSAAQQWDGWDVTSDAAQVFGRAVGGDSAYRGFGAADYIPALSQYERSAAAGRASFGVPGAINSIGSQIGWNNSIQQMMEAKSAAQAARRAELRSTVGMTAVYGTGDVMRAYTQSVTSGAPNPMGYGSAFGGIGGALVGAAFGPLGAIIGGTVGSAAVNAIQASYVARMGAAQALGGFAAASGAGAMDMAMAADAVARRTNDSWLQRGFHSENALRRNGLYTGVDQTSTKDVAEVMAAVGGGMQAGGRVPDAAKLADFSGGIAKRYGLNAPGVAKALGAVYAAGNATGGNTTDLIAAVGITNWATDARFRNREGVDDTIRAFGGVQRAGYNTQGALTDLRASNLSSTYQGVVGGLRGAVGAVDAEIGAISAMPGGASSLEGKAKKALRQELLSQIARESVSAAQSGGAVGMASANVTMTRADLYGGEGSFAAGGQQAMAALNGEYSGLQTALADRNLPFADRQAARVRLRQIDQQRLALPSQVAGASMRRGFTIADTYASRAGVMYENASLYGSDEELGSAALGVINRQGDVISAAERAYANPNLSVEDRAAALTRADGANSASLRTRAGSRDILLGRIQARAGLAQGEAAYGLEKASMLGGADDLRNATRGLVGAYDSESSQIKAQLSAGGLTVDQELRLKGRMGEIASSRFRAEQSGIDAAYAKEDIAGYGLESLRLRGQQDRAAALPFSPGNGVRLSLSSIALNRRQLGVLDAREAELRAGGNLSPERQYEIEQQRQGLLTSNALSVANISEGFENRLPALSAGGPARFRRFNNFALAAEALSRMGSPIRSFGAANGSQAKMQDDFLREAGGDALDTIGPRSTSGGMGSSARVESLLERIATALETSTGGRRPGEAWQMAVGAAAQKAF